MTYLTLDRYDVRKAQRGMMDKTTFEIACMVSIICIPTKSVWELSTTAFVLTDLYANHNAILFIPHLSQVRSASLISHLHGRLSNASSFCQSQLR